MKMSKRALTAMLVAGTMSSVAACGSDDEDPAAAGGNDSGAAPIGSTNDDAGTGPGEAGNDAGAGLTACPSHPNVTDMGQVCAITAPTGDEIKSDLTLAPVAGKQGYVLMNGVFVGEDVGGGATPDAGKQRATLTIRPGTKIFGASRLSFLLINRGSKIEAQGTREAPIVFTSAQPTPKPGDWGGLILNGRAPTNQGPNVAGEAMTGFYGGPDAADDSGALRYVRLEFTGGKVDDTNELNGVAFQGVGSGTTVEYVQSHGSDDDAFEFFGGTVNAKYLLATAPGDDGIDWVAGYSGKIQYAVVQQWPRVSSSDPNGIEADNLQTMPLAAPISAPTLANVTLIGGAGVPNAKGVLLRRGTQAKLYGVLVLGHTAGCLHVDGPESAGYAGKELAMFNSRVSCATNFIAPPASQTLLEAPGSNNVAVPVGTPVLSDPTSATAPDFTPIAGSPAASGGGVPAGDSFFESEAFIGGVGTEDWTTGWTAVTPFSG